MCSEPLAAVCAAPVPTGEEPAVEVRGVSKSYRMYDRPVDRFKQAFLWGRRELFHEFWALRDISFEVRRGETLGIIGRNGSGKSTLLQIIAGTLTPTAGEVLVRGRVAALLELGSGFNPEFTGRENVFMNAAILGLSPAETEARLDEIRNFADIGEFFDQPVKTYSSGMLVRLAFAVHAQLSPEVLIVDEALAVGDEGFQRKCFGWLENYRARNGTVLFVTHGTQLVARICERAILLDRGRLLAHGPSKIVGDVYQKLLYGSPEERAALREQLARAGGRAEMIDREWDPTPDTCVEADDSAPHAVLDAAVSGGAPASYYDPNMVLPPETTYGIGGANISDVALYDDRGQRVNVLVAGRPCELRYRVRFSTPAEGVRLGMMIKTVEGIDVIGVSSVHLGRRIPRVRPGDSLRVRFRLMLNVAPGVYFLNCGVSAEVRGEEAYLQRRVDVTSMRVIAPDERDVYGLAFTDPQMTWEVVERAAATNE